MECLNDNNSNDIILGKWVALYVPEIGLVVGRICRITRTLKTSASFPIRTFDKISKSQQGMIKVWIREYQGITGNESNLVYRKTSDCNVHNGKECLFTLQPEEQSDFIELTKDNLFKV